MSGPTLTAPFKNTQELSKGGRSFTYVPTPEVIDRLKDSHSDGGGAGVESGHDSRGVSPEREAGDTPTLDGTRPF